MKTTHEKIRVTFLRASALFAMLAASAAWAQGAPAAGPQTTAADPQASATDASSAGGLQEITVTATHVSESVNRVPITISAVTQANLDQAGILDANQLSAVVPGLSTSNGFGSVAGRQTFTIRGIGSTAGAATTGVYLDDTPLTQYQGQGVDQNNGAPVPELFDLARIEVLEGPQGTLYGGSSEGGTVRFITPSPSLTQYSGFARGQYEDTQWGAPGYLLGAAAGGPIVRDKAGFRMSVVKHKIGGWLDEYNPYSTGPLPGANIASNTNWTEEWAGRASFLAAVTERSTLQVNYYHTESFAHQTSLTGPDKPIPGETFTTPEACYNVAAARVGRGVPPKANCPPAGSPVPAGIYERPALTTGPFNFLNGTDAAVMGNGYLDDVPETQNTKLDVPAVTFEYDFGPVQFKSISSFIHNQTYSTVIDRNAAGRALNTTAHPRASQYPLFPLVPNYTGVGYASNVGNTVVQEFRLTDPGTDSRFSWVAGAYYSRSREAIDWDLFTNESPALLALYGIDAYTYYGIPDQPDHRVGTLRTSIVNTEEAAYGNLNFDVTSKLRLTAGLRISSVELQYWQINYGQESKNTASDPFATAVGSRHNVPVSPLATVQYRFTDNDMVYATASKGFRAGGVNTPLNPTDCDPGLAQYGLTISDIPKSFGPDEVWSYELGTKLRLLDNRMQLNLSAFQINWNDIQTSLRPPSGCNTGWTQNGAKAISRGANLQVRYQPVRQLNFDLTMSYIDAYYPDAVLGPKPLSGAPASVLISKGAKFSVPPLTGYLGIRYDFRLIGHDNFIRTDWQYSGSYTAGSDYGAATYSPYRFMPAWFLLNLRAGMSFGWGDLELYSTNVLNRQAWQNAQNAAGLSSFGDSGCLASGGPSCSQFIGFTPFVAAQVPTPRVVGIEVNYQF